MLFAVHPADFNHQNNLPPMMHNNHNNPNGLQMMQYPYRHQQLSQLITGPNFDPKLMLVVSLFFILIKVLLYKKEYIGNGFLKVFFFRLTS